MKKLSIGLTLGLALVLIISSIGLAVMPGTGWWTSYYIQNIGSGAGAISMTAYEKDSATTYGSSSFNFNQYLSLVYNPGVAANYPTGNKIGFSTSLPSGFMGSVVLSSSVPAASVVEIGNYINGTVGTTDGKAVAMYPGAGSSSIATKLYAPTIKHNYAGQTTSMYVQAAGADANVTITYYTNDGNTHTQTTNITANKMFVFDPANATPPVASSVCGTDANISPCYGSAIIESTTGSIAGVEVEYHHTTTPAWFALSSRLATLNDAGTKIYAPAIKNAYANGTAGISVMNIGTANANVRITLTVTAGAGAPVGTQYFYTQMIEPGKSFLFSSNRNTVGGMPANTFASAVIESLDDATYDPQPLLGLGNDSKTGIGKTQSPAFSPTNATVHLGAPMVKEWLNTRSGGLTIMNVGTAPTTIYFEYYKADGTRYKFWTLNPVVVGAAVSTYSISNVSQSNAKFTKEVGATWNWDDLDGFEYSVIAYTTDSQKIVAQVVENSTTTDSTRRDIGNYEGINY